MNITKHSKFLILNGELQYNNMDGIHGILPNRNDPNEIKITTDESEMKLADNVQASAFKVLTVAEIEEMMKQHIDDVKSIVSVSLIVFSIQIYIENTF